MHGNKRRLFLMIAGNAVLLLLMIGGPLLRAQSRARAMWQGYARASACLLGGKPMRDPGLGAARDEEMRFAAQIAKHDGAWLSRCDALLAAAIPTEAVFVWPPAKEKEARVREAVKVTRRELKALARHQPGTRIPTRPLRALTQLRTELSEHALSTAMLEAPPQTAVEFSSPATMHAPTRVPLYAGSDAVLDMWGDDETFHVLAVDRTGVSYVLVAGSDFRQNRHVRPGLLSSFYRTNEQTFFFWSASEKRCRERADGCVGSASGLASAPLPLTDLQKPRWLSAHPAGRFDRSFVRINDDFWMAAKKGASEASLRRFVLSTPVGGERDSELPPLPCASEPLQAAQLVLVQSEAALRVLAVQHDEATTTLRVPTQEVLEAKLQLSALAPIASQPRADDAFVTGCQNGMRTYFAFGGGSTLQFGVTDPEKVWAPLAVAVDVPVHQKEPARDGVQLICSDTSLTALVRDRSHVLWRITCGVDQSVCRRELVHGDVASFSGVANGSALLVAYAGVESGAQVRLARYASDGRKISGEQIPSPCFAPAGGFCEQPMLKRIGQRIVLTARNRFDLLALESGDGGAHWQGLSGALFGKL
jgi:hypothetical protein